LIQFLFDLNLDSIRTRLFLNALKLVFSASFFNIEYIIIWCFDDVMLKTSRWCKMRQILSSHLILSTSDDKWFNASSSASDEKSQLFNIESIVVWCFDDVMLKTSRWCKMRQILSSQSFLSITDDEQFNASSSASDKKSQCFEFYFKLKVISLKFLYVNAATQITFSIDEHDRTIIFITYTNCTTFRLTFKQTFNDIESRSRLSLIFRCWKMSYEANSSFSCKISSLLIIFSDDRFISSKVCWDERKILTDSDLISFSLMNSWSLRSSLNLNIMNSTWYKKYVFYHSSSSCESFDASINDAKQVSAYESDNKNSQMQYLSQVDILTDERNRIIIFVTTTDCTSFCLMLKQTFNDSQMQYLSQVNIVTSSIETSVFASKDERLTCSNLNSVCQETINSLTSYHQISCTSTSLFVSSSAASSIIEIWHAHASCRRRELQECLERKTLYAKKHSKKRRRFWIRYDHVFHSICQAESEWNLN